MAMMQHVWVVAAGLIGTALGLAAVPNAAYADERRANATAQSGVPRVEYAVDLRRAQTQTIDVAMTLRGGREVWGDALEIAMPIWRPGRYQVLDLAGGIQAISAKDGEGRELPMRKFDRATWRVEAGDATEVRVEYRLYCNSLGERTRHVDATHAFLSGSAVFLYAPKMRHMPLRVTLETPEGWKVATGLRSVEGRPGTLIAPDYDVLVDSPIEAGEIEVLTFEADGKPHEIAVWASGGGGPSYDAEKVKEDFRKIVEACIEIFGDTPYDRYVFLVHVAPGAGGGTEHLNSTIMQTTPGAFDTGKAYRGFLGLAAHEFFHTWNVKQLRPRGLVPYDYQRENYTDLLWIAEGTTSYYDDLILARRGLMKESDYFDVLGGTIGGYLDSPGRGVQSLEMSSFDSWIKFNKPAPDGPNTTVNFYSVGALASFVLDMEMRRRTDGAVTLDDVMREMYRRYPLSGGGFSSADFTAVVEEMTGSEFRSWFDAHIAGTEEMDVRGALEVVGLELVREPAKPDKESARPARERQDKPYVGIRVKDASGLAQVTHVMTDGPAFEAGVIPGDEIVAVNGVRARAGDFDSRIDRLVAGAEVRLTLLRRDELKEITLTSGARPDGSWKVKRVKDPSEAQKRAMASWLKKTETKAEEGDAKADGESGKPE